ncbi:MAG: BON domain-containing protein [Pseudonocardia sp.]|uniref:BON domain-containing protein n=1 Tax=Pseudonocardia sp. TaxID=60912 RepID=UPI001AC64697|nr:BON domain-containing protein [Pseudonocardia sp.]MBN9096674.1 BON domain-containing protein [Pseudonocardia sp.]
MTSTPSGPDADLKSAVVQELEWTPGVDSTHIGVSVDGGAVTLSGEVATYPEKLLAANAVQRVHGVTAIAQEITVRVTGGTNDSDIAREAGEALRRAVDVPESVQASVHDHVVTLSGVVDSRHQWVAAERTVHRTRGVTGVLNLVRIRPVAMASGVEAAITAAFVRHARIDSRDVTVTTAAGGLVTLEGTVRSWAESQDAEEACWAAAGVTEVSNRLLIEYGVSDGLEIEY